jgi:DNA/RNA-binding domain of Phe-tRNA-synthetase-like protein
MQSRGKNSFDHMKGKDEDEDEGEICEGRDVGRPSFWNISASYTAERR